jgi:transcriptional regulator of acetoin/glycerol metabolism
MTLQDIEKRAIVEALERNQWRRMATARELSIDKNTLRRKMIRHGLTGEASSESANPPDLGVEHA